MIKELGFPIAPKPIIEDVSVLIPTLGRPIIESCFRWLVDGTCWPSTLIVVDQGCNPMVSGWVERLEGAGLKAQYIRSTQIGRSAARNRGLEQVTTRFVAMIDDDCFVTANWLAHMVMRLRQQPGTIVTGRVEQAGNTDVAFSVVTSRELKRYERPQLTAHPFISGNAGLAIDLVHFVGPFDEHSCLESAEDNDYGYRALRLGIPILYDPELVLFHHHWRDVNQRAVRYAEYARSQGGFYGTHLWSGDWMIWRQAARDLIRGPVRWLRGAVKDDRDMIDRGRADTLNMLPGIAAGLRRGRQLE